MLQFAYLPMMALFPVVVTGLWYAYKRMGQANRIPVGSAFYLKKLVGVSSSRKRFVPPIRFLIELFSLLLLVLASAGVFLKRDGIHALIILDNSRSMGGVVNGEVLLDLAKSRALSDVQNGGAVLPSLLVTGAPERIVTKDISDEIEKVMPVDLEDGLEDLIARERGRFDEVWVYSDKRPSPTLDPTIKFSPLVSGSSPLNVGILKATQTNNGVRVSLVRNGPGAETVKVSLKKYENGSLQTAALTKTIKILDTAEVDFNLGLNTPIEILVAVPQGGNAINADDKAWLVPSDTKTFRVHGDLAIDSLKFEGFKFFPASENSQSIANDIFYKVNGDSKGSALFILPPFAVNSKLGAAREVLSIWHGDNPLLKYLFSGDLSNVPYLPLNLSEQTQIVAGGAAGLLLGAVDGANRQVFSGLDLFPFDSKNVAKSILLLNILNWLSEPQMAGNNGAVLQSKSRYFSLNNDELTPPINAGLYRVHDGGRERLEAVNLFSASESKIGEELGAIKESAAAKATKSSEVGLELWRYIVYLVLLIAVLELLVSSIRRARA